MFVKIPLILSILLAAGPAVADDEVLNPPGGPVYVEADVDAEIEAPVPQAGPRRRGGQRDLRRVLIERFDANRDGRLEPQERQRAMRALRKLQRRMAMRSHKLQRLIQRFDKNGDGNVGPGELPPRAQNKLRRLDRNGDGWIDRQDMRRQDMKSR
jgi:hypothetical protein